MAAKIYHFTRQEHPELKLAPWRDISKASRRSIASMSREQFVAEMTAQVLADGEHECQEGVIPAAVYNPGHMFNKRFFNEFEQV